MIIIVYYKVYCTLYDCVGVFIGNKKYIFIGNCILSDIPLDPVAMQIVT